MDCNSCKNRTVPYLVHEGAMARAERTIKRLWILLIILIALLAGTNGAWIYYESQWEVVETDVTQEADGNGTNNYIGGNVYGTADYPYETENP